MYAKHSLTGRPSVECFRLEKFWCKLSAKFASVQNSLVSGLPLTMVNGTAVPLTHQRQCTNRS